MIIFVGGLIGAGKSTIAKGLANRFDFPYYDVDEVKKVVYRQDPDYRDKLARGIPFPDELRVEVFQRVFADLEQLVDEHPHIIVDEALHKREIRHALYDEARKLAGGFIVIWVHARKKTIRKRLGKESRKGHILDDPLPMHMAFRKEFEKYQRCIIDCPNDDTPEKVIGNLITLIERIASLVAPAK